MLQSGGNAGVNEAVSVLKLQTAEDAWVDEEIETDLLAKSLRQPFGDTITIAVGKLDGGGDRGADASCELVGQAPEPVSYTHLTLPTIYSV